MGGQSVPAATSSNQNIVTGWMASPATRKRALGIIDPALSGLHNQQQMLLGFQQGDPNQTRKLFGLSPEAPMSDVERAIALKSQGPQIQMPQVAAAQQGPQGRTAAHGGIMSIHDDEPEKDPRKFAKGGDSTPQDITKQQADTMARWQQQGNLTAAKQRQIDKWTQQRQDYQTYKSDQSGISDAGRRAGLTPADAYLGQAGFFGGALTIDPVTGKQVFSVTNPYYNQAVNVLQGMNQQPQQFQQATQAYQDALGGLKSAAGYTPQQVAAQQVSADQVKAAQIARGDIRDVAAQQAQVERMAGARNVRGATMSGPQSWTEQGVARQYMNPYTQNVLDQELFEANRQAQMRENQQQSQAAQQKAFGGTRAALQQSEGRRNLGYLLSDIEAKGLQQAYGQGMQQFQQEQGLGQQAKQTNVGSLNQAALANQLYGTGGFQAQAANMAAQNQAYNNYVQQALTAQGMNQGMDWNTASQNATMQMQAMLANQQANLQASMANQSTGLQASLANQNAGLQANQQALGAYGQMAGIGQGLGSLGTQIGGYGQNLANLWGQAGSTLQGLGQGFYNQQQQNAMNIWGGPTNMAAQGVNLLSGAGGQSGTIGRQTTPGSAFG